MTRALLLILFGCFSACARTPEGPLGPLRIPNDGRPAITTAGGSFDVVVERKGEISVERGDERIALTTNWGVTDKDGLHASCTVPADLPDGAHTVVWTDGTDTDRTVRSLFVLQAIPSLYSLITDAEPIPSVSDPKNKEKASAAWVDTLNTSGAAFGLVFANDANGGFGTLLSRLNACTIPTYVISAADSATKWFGPATFAFSIGKDNYVSLATGRAGLEDTYGDAPNAFALLSAAQRSSRWTVCIMPYFDAEMSMRNEITLFVDRPFHAVLCAWCDASPAPKKIDWTGWFPATPVFPTLTGTSALLTVQNSKEPFKAVRPQSRKSEVDQR